MQTSHIKWAIFGVIALIASIICWPFYSVPTGSRGVVTQFGKITGIEGEGLAVLPPWQKLSNFSIRAETANVESAEGSTSDQQPVHVSLTVRYSIGVDKVAEVFEKYSHDGDLSSYVNTATQEIFKAVTARYNAPELISKRSQVSHDILIALQGKLVLYGAQVINIDMKNFSFSQSYMSAINDKVTQEQLKLAAENRVKTAEAEQRIKVVTAEAERDAIKASADGTAYQIRVQNQALRESKDILELRRIEVEKIKAEKWDGALPVNNYASAPIPFLQTYDMKRNKAE